MNYSSVCNYSDCNFVAAADWERIADSTQPPASLIKAEYAAAHQTFHGGLHMPDLWSYWKQPGVDGVYATKVTVWSHSQGAVQNGVLDLGALIVELEVSKKLAVSDRFSVYGTVVASVDGFDPKGPLVVFETKTTQLTWAQWNSSAPEVWKITVSNNSPTPPSTTTTTTVPPVTTTTLPVATTTTTTTTVPPTTSTTTTVPTSGPPAYDYGPQNETYQTYGNVAPADLGDCTFAAAANWEQLLLGASPDPSAIGYEFAQAGGTANGLTMTQLFDYWYQYGITGYYLHGYTSYYTTQVDVENGVQDYGAMIVDLQFRDGDYFGTYQMSAGGHAVVVDGYTPEGPLVVSWGTTIQMSWQQWNAEVVGMYSINASSTPN